MMSHATADRTRARFAAAMVLGAGLMVPQTSLAACAGGVYDLPSQFVGTWREYTVTDTGEVFAGTLRSELVADGCGYRQAFTGADGTFSFQSLGYVDAEEQAWRETVVTSTGRVAHYRCRVEGADVVFDRLTEDGIPRRRLRATAFAPDRYDVVDERSADGGQRWDAGQITRIRRVE